MGNCLEVKNISKAFVGVQALDNISFRADEKSFSQIFPDEGLQTGKQDLLAGSSRAIRKNN